VLRLYVASMDYTTDIEHRSSERGQSRRCPRLYRKIRNTFRYMLGNVEDYHRFDPSEVDPASLQEIDAWDARSVERSRTRRRADYERFEFTGPTANLSVLAR